MTFVFSLQRVLELREQGVKQCELELEQAKVAMQSLRQLLSQERDRYFNEREELNESIKKALLHKIAVFENSLMSRQKRMMDILTYIRHLEEDIDLLEQNLIQARRNLKIIENLRDKKLAQYQEKIIKAEKKLFDERALQRYTGKGQFEFTMDDE